MKPLQMCLRMWAIFLSLSWACLISNVYASEICKDWVAEVVSVQGMVETRQPDQKLWEPIGLNDILCPGDMIRTLERSRAAIKLSDDSILRMDQMTTLTINAIKKKELSLINLLKGAVHFFSRVHRRLKVATPFVNG
ncbi:MAG: FecR family protein, partial [Thermodesulfobacteriota bacterium]